MSGVFAEWQPRYAQHRVATFPVEQDPLRAQLEEGGAQGLN